MSPQARRAWFGLGCTALLASLLLPACAKRGSDRGAGRRIHGLVRHLHAEVPSLGLVTGLSPAPTGGVIAAGSGGAARVDAAGGVEPMASAPGPASRGVEPLAVGERVALVSRGADGDLALYDAGGRARARAPAGAHDLAAGDLDGDGQLDLVAGLPKREGLRRMDHRGRVRWTRSEVDPWEVRLADTDGDGSPEIVHSNRQGALVVRDAEGRVLHRFETGRMARHFALVAWPDARLRILQRSGDRVELYSPEGEAVASLEARVWNDRGRVEAVVFEPRGDGERWLAVLDRLYGDAPSVLTVFDSRGNRMHEEVFLDGCASVGALDGAGVLVGCEGLLWRYELGRVDPRTILSVPRARRSGDLFGPLRFGDSPRRVRALSTLLPGHACRLKACERSYLELDGRHYLLAPEFEDGGLARVALLALPEPLDTYDETQAAWKALIGLVSERHGRPRRGSRRFPSPSAVVGAPPEAGWRTYRTHHWKDGSVEIELGVATLDDEEPLQYMAYASFNHR